MEDTNAIVMFLAIPTVTIWADHVLGREGLFPDAFGAVR